MRLLISPFGTQGVATTTRGRQSVGFRSASGVNRSLDKLPPLSPHMETDFGIMPTMAQASEGFVRNLGRPHL